MKYEIEENDVKAIIAYMQNRPYAEVYRGIDMLLKLKKIKEVVKASETEKKENE